MPFSGWLRRRQLAASGHRRSQEPGKNHQADQSIGCRRLQFSARGDEKITRRAPNTRNPKSYFTTYRPLPTPMKNQIFFPAGPLFNAQRFSADFNDLFHRIAAQSPAIKHERRVVFVHAARQLGVFDAQTFLNVRDHDLRLFLVSFQAAIPRLGETAPTALACCLIWLSVETTPV